MSRFDDEPSTTSLIGNVLEQVSGLFRSEIDLARAEVAAGLKRMAIGAAMIAASLPFAMAALVLLLEALASLFAALGLDDALSNLLAALVGFAICGILAWLGVSRMSADSLVPRRTIHQLQQDAAVAKEQAR